LVGSALAVVEVDEDEAEDEDVAISARVVVVGDTVEVTVAEVDEGAGVEEGVSFLSPPTITRVPSLIPFSTTSRGTGVPLSIYTVLVPGTRFSR
jgi:hypothetical protein